MAELKKQKLEAVVIQLNNPNNIEVMAGSINIDTTPDIPFSEIAIAFLSELSRTIRKSEEAIIYPDLMAFSFWCREGNLKLLKREQSNLNRRLGRGMVFHIAPSNVPLNFGYSYIFGLLSGNANVVKIPSKKFPQGEYLCKTIDSFLRGKEYETLYDKTLFIKYKKDNSATKYFSSVCDARIIWGGDSTIKNVRQYEIPVRSVEIAFADRYSICVINVKKIQNLSKSEFSKLIELFYNDTFLMDQNACSSPHMVIWHGEDNNNTKKAFWDALEEYVKANYELKSLSVIDKYTKLCQTAIDINVPFEFISYDNLIYRLSLNKLPNNIHEFRGSCGYIYEYTASNLDEITHIINNKYQTMTYYGLDRPFLVDFVTKNKLVGIDRIVPIGKALDISLIWDGIEVISSLSRIINYS